MLSLFITTLFSFLGILDSPKLLSPLDFGLNSAKNGQERFNVIYKTHKIAQEIGGAVSYANISNIDIEIPRGAKSIPLTLRTDFNGVTFNVINNVSDIYLFTLLGEKEHPITVDHESFTTYNFKRHKKLSKGHVLLIVKDNNPWVESRSGHNYGATRKDILLLKDGRALNKTIATYDNTYSSPECSFVPVSTELKQFSNITFNRDVRSTCKTLLIKVNNMNNVEISNVAINTPAESKIRGDAAISIYNCTNVNCRNIKINNTYSAMDFYGYGILMDNVWNSAFYRIEANCQWGVFGNNNINKVEMRNCIINRFDVHCYGKDFSFYDCSFNRTGVPLSSMFGTLMFKSCTFNTAISCMYRSDYNAYTPFSIIYDGCTFNLDRQHNCLIYTSQLSSQRNKRPELYEKSLPDLFIKNSVVNLPNDMKQWEIYHIGENYYSRPVSNISTISIDGLQVRGADANVILFTKEVVTKKTLNISISGVDLLQVKENEIFQASSKYVYYPSIIYNVNLDRGMHIEVSSSRLNYNAIDNPHYNICFSKCTLGRVRYYNTGNGIVSTRREYRDCSLILDCDDANDYLIDANADYINCTFKPCIQSRKIIPMSMEDNAIVTFENCKIAGKGKIYMNGQTGDYLLKDSQYDVHSKNISKKIKKK